MQAIDDLVLRDDFTRRNLGMMCERNRQDRGGFTLIEVLVTIGICVVLIGLILPAVQYAREAARRTHCIANLRQLGLALNSYATSVGTLPLMNNGRAGFSYLAMILPQVEQPAVFESLNFEVPFDSPENRTADSVSLALFLCPSDRGSARPIPWTNYAGCSGYGYQLDHNFNGMFTKRPSRPVAFADVNDGTSSTIMLSEWVLGPGTASGGDQLSITYSTKRLDKPDDFKQFIESCAGSQVENSKKKPYMKKGSQWVHSSHGSSIFNANLKVNDHSCLNGGLIFEGAWTAGSRHSSGANTAFADGHVQFVQETIALETWRAMATRSRGETISAQSE